MIRRNFLKGISALFAGFLPQKKLHTDLDYAHVDGPYPRWQLIPYLDGKPLHFCQEANAKEGWADVFVFDHSKNEIVCSNKDGSFLVDRLRGQVQIFFATAERLDEFQRTAPYLPKIKT